MFNGLSMWTLWVYKNNFDAGSKSPDNSPTESYENSTNEQLNKIKSEIAELTDGDNTVNDKIEIQWILTTEFANYLNDHKNIAWKLRDAVEWIQTEGNQDNTKAKTDLITFLKPIVNPVEFTGGIVKVNTDNGNLYEKNLDQWTDAITKKRVKEHISKILNTIWESDNSWDSNYMKNYRNTIKNIGKVLDNPNPTSTKDLQIFILSNLDPTKADEKPKYDEFLKNNFRKDKNNKPIETEPDWLFGQYTLNWVEDFLDKMDKQYEASITAQKQVMTQNNPENPSVVTDWDPDKATETIERPKVPKYPINGKLEWINKWKEEEREIKLWSDLKREKPVDWQPDAPEWTKLYETIDNISWLLSRIESYLNMESLKDDMENLKNNLVSIQDVINNTTQDNVRELQEFIAKNLDESWKFKKSVFDTLSKKNGVYDGKFWKGTLAWLNAVLKKVGDYFKEVDTYLNQMDDYNKKQMDKITWKSDVKKWETDAKNLVDNLPEGATVDFKNDEEKEKLNKTGEQNIELVVKLQDGTEKEITVKVTVVDSSEQPGDAPAGPASIEIGDGDSKKTYQVVENSSSLATTLSIPWATFYYTTVPETENWWAASGNWWPAQENLWAAPGDSTQSDGELEPPKTDNVKEYYMQISGKTELYKIRLEDWFLYPIITKINPKTGKVKGKDLIANNDSCICYLQNKLPNKIKCNIGWASKAQYWEAGDNYYLESYGQKLTIEPMSIAWDWISNDLWRNLAFINLTNYIRDTWKKHKKSDPDVNRKVDKFKWIKDSSWSKLSIDKSDFWLENASDVELARFKRYNNGEHWDDNWDEKRKNKDYGRLVLNI